MTSKRTVDLMTQLGNILEGQHGDVMRAALSAFLHELMDADAERLCGAAYGERTADRVNARNGVRERDLETRVGTIPLGIPKLRKGSYLPPFLTPRRRWEQAFTNVVAESFVLGVSTRKVEDLVEAMGATGMSKSEVSRMAAVLDDQVKEFRARTFDKAFPYVWLDAIYVKVREGGRGVSKAVLIATGVNADGEREVLGMQVADNEMTAAWRSFLAGLVERGLTGVRMVVSDAHPGLRAAIRSVLNGTTWQRCYVHFVRELLGRIPKASAGLVAAALRNVFQQTSREHAHDAMTKVIETLASKWPQVAELVREAEDDLLAYFDFPEAHWRQIRSTNPIERLNKELRRRTRVVGIFPSSASVLRLVGMLLVEQHDEWTAFGRRYFSEASMRALLEPTAVAALEDRHAAK